MDVGRVWMQVSIGMDDEVGMDDKVGMDAGH